MVTISKDIWHKKTEQPKKLLHCTRLIITKWGSVFNEKDIDNGAFIETDWAYLDDLLALETNLDRTKKQLERAIWWLNEIVENHRYTPISTAEMALKEIKALEQKEQQ